MFSRYRSTQGLSRLAATRRWTDVTFVSGALQSLRSRRFPGLGFGLMFWLGSHCRDQPGWWRSLFFCHCIFCAGRAGLIARPFHTLVIRNAPLLGFTQWRSSWLSREADLRCSSVLWSLGLYAIGRVFFTASWSARLVWRGFVPLQNMLTTSMITPMKTRTALAQPAYTCLYLTCPLGARCFAGQVRSLGLLILLVLPPCCKTGMGVAGGPGLCGLLAQQWPAARDWAHIGKRPGFSSPPHTGPQTICCVRMVILIGRKNMR